MAANQITLATQGDFDSDAQMELQEAVQTAVPDADIFWKIRKAAAPEPTLPHIIYVWVSHGLEMTAYVAAIALALRTFWRDRKANTAGGAKGVIYGPNDEVLSEVDLADD